MAPDRPTCYRCDDPVDDAHRIHLSSTHAGERADRVRDVTRRVCLDCLAAIGMLEIAEEAVDRDEPSTSPVQSRLAPIRSLRGGD